MTGGRVCRHGLLVSDPSCLSHVTSLELVKHPLGGPDRLGHRPGRTVIGNGCQEAEPVVIEAWFVAVQSQSNAGRHTMPGQR